MKTSLTCLGILAAALVLGNLQGSRLEKLQQQFPFPETVYRSKAHDRESSDQVPAYRSKYERTSKHAVAKDVFQSLLGYREGRTSMTMGDMASMTDRNKDALKAILQLDLSGLKELITLISQSKEPVLAENYAVKYEQISLCIIALADQDPGHALDYVMNAEKEMDSAVFRDEGTKYWLQYILTRLEDRDPQRALDGLVKLTGDSVKPWGDDDVLTILAKFARQNPGLVLETIDRLPETKHQYFLVSLAFQMESDDERTALFQALRNHFRLQPELIKAGFASLNLESLADQMESADEHDPLFLALRAHFQLEPESAKSGVVTLKSMRAGLASLFRRFSDARESPAELRQWADSLEMSAAEKHLIFDSLNNIDISTQDAEEYARWFAKFMPESNARKRLVWKACSEWEKTDAEKTLAFLAEQNIDPQEMMRLGQDAD